MKNKRCTEIKLEEYEITVIRFKGQPDVRRLCGSCGSNARHLTVSRAAKLLRISERTVFNLIEGDRVHSSETTTGALLVCRNSLDALLGNPDDALFNEKKLLIRGDF